MSLTPLSVVRVPAKREAPPERTKGLQPPTHSLFRLREDELKTGQADLDRRSAELDGREYRIRSAEAALAEKERVVVDRPPPPEQPRPPVGPTRTAETVVTLGPANPATTAMAIIRCGKIARGELVPKPPAPRTDAEKMAAMIVAAAAKARSTAPPPELPEDLTARAIVLCGQKARGAIDASGERWLEDYFARAEAIRGLMS